MSKTSEMLGEDVYNKRLQQTQAWKKTHLEQAKEQIQEWKSEHPKEVKKYDYEFSHKKGKYYEQRREYDRNGLRHERNLVRNKHRIHYYPYKRIIAPASQIHHEWIPETADYTGIALVEADQHTHGYIDVIQILEGKITLLTEAEIRGAIERNG